MGKVPKNFALLKRSANPRVSMRRLQANSSGSTSSAPDDHEPDDSGSRKERGGGDETEEGGGFFRGSGSSTDWAPSLSAVFKILFSMRLSASLWSVISDCDEVYNYWEPLHMLLYGRGFQTWEYSPAYAIRSWLYILLYAGPAHLLLPLFAHSKVTMFFTLRFIIGFVTLLSELLLYRLLCRRLGNSMGRCYVLFSLFSNAMFGASCAFLPSSFSMAMNSFAIAFYLGEQWFLAILFTAASALLGWPFAALLGLPIALEMLLVRPRQLALRFVAYSALAGALLGAALFAVDSHFFGRPVLAPLNIVLYNVFSPHGPSLYGVESASFYLRNLLLNFNLAFPLAVLAIPLASACVYFAKRDGDEKRRKDGETPATKTAGKLGGFADWPLKRWNNLRPVLFLGLTALLWLLIFLLQPHKEERFLFPIYPHICVLAGLCLECLYRLMPDRKTALLLCATLLGLFVLVSFSRTLALHRNYAGLLDSYKAFNDQLAGGHIGVPLKHKTDPIRLCVGKEWHRFPSSFFLPEQAPDQFGQRHRVELRFVRSEFRGLLPDLFPDIAAAEGTPIANVTRLVPVEQNDRNQEEPSRYVPVESCDFLLDLEGPEPTTLEPDYSKMPVFQSVIQRRVLITAQSHPLFRAFYIPFTPADYLKFGTIHMLQRKVPTML